MRDHPRSEFHAHLELARAADSRRSVTFARKEALPRHGLPLFLRLALILSGLVGVASPLWAMFPSMPIWYGLALCGLIPVSAGAVIWAVAAD
jgi:hypothetical protein